MNYDTRGKNQEERIKRKESRGKNQEERIKRKEQNPTTNNK